ncbi:MAG: SPASM domain-containing protein [Deltaproteobacteria bacterium]|nr:SPASM domain-containing protein [Deltaproteobacteria bacterium]
MFIESSRKIIRGQNYGDISKKKLLNYYSTYYEINARFPDPSQVLIETRTDCNRKCSFCPQSHHERPFKEMEWTVFEKIISDLANVNFSGRIAFFITNEPLLETRLLKMLRHTKENCPRAFLDINTNGQLLTASLLEDLFKEGLDNINIEDYMSAEKYDKGYKAPNIKEIIKSFKDNPKITYHKRSTNEVLSNRAGNVKKESSLTKEKSVNNFCYYPFKKLAIGSTGEVVLCCMDYKYEVCFDHIMEHNIFTIWHSEPANNYRRMLLSGKRENFCANCDEGLYEEKS